MADNDEEFVSEYLEKAFGEKLKERLRTLREKGYRFSVVEDVIGRNGQPIPRKVEILDSVFIKGLFMDRSKNLSEDQYHIFNDADNLGMMIYTPLKLADPENFIDPEMNKKIYQESGHSAAVVRMLVSIKCPYVLQVKPPNSDVPLAIDQSLTTWEHLCLFESQLVTAEFLKSSYRLQTYLEWMSKFKWGKWQLADLDNWMEGNKLIQTGKLADAKRQFKGDIFKGSKFDRSLNVDLKDL